MIMIEAETLQLRLVTFKLRLFAHSVRPKESEYARTQDGMLYIGDHKTVASLEVDNKCGHIGKAEVRRMGD